MAPRQRHALVKVHSPKEHAIAKAAPCPSVTAPKVRPAMKSSISAALSAAPSRFLRMIS